ncbi:hypothetical protein QBC46DRAFT_428060 [Diplogelasinospora grovesii]|uniref:FAD-binding PCMH-type domain-containing protein n=1 Tax=Diplogelasinospora grovesii TaxID=303347 RepID=A0AAN6RY87_9PEZI|nr:hypothetical protein QBC46DRAFT_428060 [Diplogelasinospora grovesii]
MGTYPIHITHAWHGYLWVPVVFTSPIPSFRPGDSQYERSVATANLLYRFSKPDFVVQPKSPLHVQTIIKTAVPRGLKITIKNGGHSFAGFSTTNRGILVDLCHMQDVRLHDGPSGKPESVTLGGGIGQLNGGRCPTVGVSGLVLGVGLGPFTRKLGMGCDALTEATIVTADGELVTVKESDDKQLEKGKLFWALRGAGGGNFGVVVELKMKVQRVEDGVLDGPFIDTMKKLYLFDWPPEATIDTHWVCDVKPNKASSVRFDGKKGKFDKLIDRAIGEAHPQLADRMKERTCSEPSTLFLHETLVAQWWEETTRAFPSNKSYSLYTSFVFEKRPGIVEIVADKAILEVTWIHAGGNASKPKSDQTAFPWRDGTYSTYIMLQWEEKWLAGKIKRFLEAFKAELKPFSMERRAAYVNFADVGLRDCGSVYYGDKYPKLQEVKQIWDRRDYFHPPQGVRLPGNENNGEDSVDWMDLAEWQWEHRPVGFPTPKDDFAGTIRDLTDLRF